jgi:2-polyprenyl-3-methyl-5-hydroxy-6-metoxy-1,4-benzoquinol methylase
MNSINLHALVETHMQPVTSTTHDGTCLVCGEARSAQRFVQRGYAVFRCHSCGFEFVSPTPSADELAHYYDRGYEVPLERYAAASVRNAARIEDLERWCPGRGRLLEVGASWGHSLAAARDRGWDVAGVELSPSASSYAREHFGLTVFNCQLIDAPLVDASFDAVIMWHVLEHVCNPREELARLAMLLKPGGVLGLRVPNIESFGARVAGQWWPWMCPPAHLWFFSPATLPRLLTACGFEAIEVKTLRGDGNNLYQYALMAGGNGLNELRSSLRRHPRSHLAVQAQRAPRSVPGSTPAHSPAHQPQEPSGILQSWLHILERAQPMTNALARSTRVFIEPLERRGWGDELLVYSRRIP